MWSTAANRGRVLMYESSEEEEDDDSTLMGHVPDSPAAGAESLFRKGGGPALLVSDLQSILSIASSEETGSTDDYRTACQSLRDDELTLSSICSDSSFPEIHKELDPTYNSEMAKTKTMSSASRSSAPTSTKPKLKDTSKPATDSVDAASGIYEQAKGVWAWGKGVPVVKFGLGVTEAVATKAAEMAGTDLEEVDGMVKPHLATFDTAVLNPAITKVVEIVLVAAGKTEGIVKPIVIQVLSPFGLIKNEPENPELTKYN